MGGSGHVETLAIVSSDVVGSTAFLTERGVSDAISSLSWFDRLVADEFSNGKVLDKRGDGVITGFTSAVEALRAARSLQERAAQHDELQLRTVILIADVGHDGVLPPFVERWLEALDNACAPGDVLIDRTVVSCVRGIKGFRIDTATDGYARLLSVDIDTAADATASDADSRIQAVMMTDLEDSEEIIDNLTRAQLDGAATISAHGGRIVDRNKAGHLAVFSSCTAAVDAAVALHSASALNNLRHDRTGRYEYSVAVSVGEVAMVEDRAYGIAVVEAARLLDLKTDQLTIEQTGTSQSDGAVEPSAGSSRTVFTNDVAAIGGRERSASSKQFELNGIADPVEVFSSRPALPMAMPLPDTLTRPTTFPLVGRADEEQQLASVWGHALTGSVAVAVVTGEEGVGKTRLVREAAAKAHLAGAIVLHGICDNDIRIPYAPVAAALEQAAQVAPDLTTLDSSGFVADQRELLDAVATDLRELSVERPVLLVIDDIQWADVDTMQLIARLFTHPGHGRLAIMATCRSEHLDRASNVQLLLGSKRGDDGAHHLRLDRLGTEHVVAMLSTLAPESEDNLDIARLLIDVTGGSPLYIEELIDHLLESNSLNHDSTGRWTLTSETELALPDSLVELMARRAHRLGPKAIEVLSTAAVVGITFDHEVVAYALDRPLAAILECLDAAVNARLIIEAPASSGATFSDELTREALLRELTPTQRAVIHEKIANALEVVRPNHIDLLAAHWSAAIGHDARAKAVRYLRQAAARDMDAAAWDSSVDRHRQILDLLTVDGDDDSTAAEVHYGLGLSLRKLGKDEYRPELLQAATLARKTLNGELLASCAVAMMRPGAWYPEAEVVDTDIVEMCEDALLLLGPESPDRARVLAALAVNLTYYATVEERTVIIEEAQSLAEQSGDLAVQGTALAAELITFHEPHRDTRRCELAHQVRRIGRATGDRDLLFVGSWFIVLDLISHGNVEEAEQLVDELAHLVEATNEYWPAFLVSHFASAIAIARCEPEAPRMIEEKYSQFETQPVDSFGVCVIQQASVAVTQGTLADMLLSLFEAANEYDETPEWAMKWNYAVSKAYLDAGDTEAALAAIALNPNPQPDYYWMASVYHLGLLGLKLGDETICNDVLDKLSPFRGRIAIIGLGACLGGQVSTALGQAHLGLGNLSEAEELFREAIAQADQAGFVYFATQARRYLCETLLLAEAASPELEELIENVQATSERYGFAIEASEATQLAASVEASIA